MARTSTVVQVGKHKIELSNLKKVLFPEDHIIKAEIIDYYVKVAPTILKHVKGRPLSFVRYPDGIAGQAFFQKNRPDWAPDWIEYATLGAEDKIDYILATNEASLVWLANLACIEFHQIHSRAPHFDKPDYVVFDLDPPEGHEFAAVVDLAFQLKEHIESFGYHAFVKTTGGKGLHLVAPIDPEWSIDRVFDAASDMAKGFVNAHSRSTTLHLKKEARGGRVLIDIYRNRTSQTIVSAYSIRGRAGAPVSMPLHWEVLASVTDQSEFNIRTVPDLLVREGDPWETMGAYATALHTERKPGPRKPVKLSPAPAGTKLKSYADKRSFAKTPEPQPDLAPGSGDAFVVHRHHASHLHYDLRLESEGTLKSWAVPKGLPPRPAIKRLAVAVEDHPIAYAEFEGTIPKREYGGGRVWIFARGKYEITKQKKDGFYMRLKSRELNSEYRMINTRGKEWLLERLERPQVDWLRDPIEPMLAQLSSDLPESSDFLYEVKWDGIRALISLDEGQLTIRSRSRRDITQLFPELVPTEQAFRASCGLFDGEIVCLDAEGKPVFEHVVRRLQQTRQSSITRESARHPAVCYVFDCLYLDGRDIIHEPLTRRREWLSDAIRHNTVYRVSETLDDGASLYEAATRMGLEGIMAKDRNSPYLMGKRSGYWLKVKAHQTAESVIIGYTRGKGDRERFFGALHLGRYNGSELEYAGKVGGGFDEKLLKTVFDELKKIPPAKRPIKQRPPDDSQTVWLRPQLFCEVRYSSLTKDGAYREPVFLRLRPDLDFQAIDRL